MKKGFLVALSLVLLLILAMPLGYSSENRWGGVDRDRLLGKVMPGYIQSAGTAFGASLTMASTATGVSTAMSLAYSFIGKVIGADVGELGSLADGTKGQILKIYIVSRAGSGTYVLTPATATGFSTLTFDAAAEEATLLYVDDTVGWIIIGSNGVTIAA